MRRIMTILMVALFVAGCVTTTLPDGTQVREWDTATIWEMARIGQEIAVLRAELREREHMLESAERRERERHIEDLLERLADLRGEYGQD